MKRISSARLSRWVWLINGVILLGALLVMGAAMLIGWLGARRGPPPPEPDAALPAGAGAPALIRYDLLDPVEGRATRIALVRDGRGLPSGPLPSAASGRPAGGVVNVAFLAQDGTARLLFDRPVRVLAISLPGAPEWLAGPLPVSPGQEHIFYAAATADTNGDGAVDGADAPALLVSSLDGVGLRTVLPGGMRLGGARLLAGGRWLVSGEEGDGAARRVHNFVFDPATSRLAASAALDSLAARAAAIARGR